MSKKIVMLKTSENHIAILTIERTYSTAYFLSVGKNDPPFLPKIKQVCLVSIYVSVNLHGLKWILTAVNK